MSSVTEEDLVGMDADPSCTQPPGNVAPHGRAEQRDHDQIETRGNLECARRYAGIAPWGYGREPHAGTERKENEGQGGGRNCTGRNRWP